MGEERWGHKAEYVLSLLGFAIGVGSIWKFPYMCARNGGGSYLIPYMFFVFAGTIPLTYLEMFIGQFSQQGQIGAWDICPALRGLGGGATMLSSLFSIYYSTFFSWIMYYFFFSFFPVLPWTQCGQYWNTPNCVEDFSLSNQSDHSNVSTMEYTPVGYANASYPAVFNTTVNNGIPAAEEFFRNNVLGITDGLEDMGTLRWPLVGCLAITFLCVYFCIIKGIRISGKVVYVTVIAPFILVTIILIRACMLPGSLEGIKYYITPRFNRITDFSVWMEACSFALYAPGVSYGIIINMAAHNPVNSRCLRDSVVVNVCCALAQIYFGFSVFAITGHLAHVRGVNMDHYQTSGFKLGFITYPEATAFLPLPQLWSVMLFLMLFTLGIDSLIPPFEVVTNLVGRSFPSLRKRRWLLNAVVMIPSFLLAVPYTAQGGVYLLTLVEWFAFFPSLVLFAIFECIAVGWIFGIQRLNRIMMLVYQTKLEKFMEIMWKFICPIMLLVVFAYSFYVYRPPQLEDYVYAKWANVIGWMISTTIVLPLPVYFVWAIYKSPGKNIRERVFNACQPINQWDITEEDFKEQMHLQDS